MINLVIFPIAMVFPCTSFSIVSIKRRKRKADLISKGKPPHLLIVFVGFCPNVNEASKVWTR